MRLLVLLEFHFIRDRDGKVYTEVTGDSNFWSRYLDVFENITVCARIRDAEESFNPSNYLLASRKNVKFVSLPEFKGMNGLVKNYLNVRRVVKQAIEECDCAIFRAPSPISLVIYPIIKKSKKPFSVELMMNPYSAYSKEALKHPMQPLIQYIITKQTKKMCITANGVSYVTDYVLQDLYPCRAILYKNKKNKSKYFTSSYSTITLRENDFYYKDWNKRAKDESITLLHSGKMEDYRKGQLTFIRIIGKLTAKSYKVRGIMLGDGSKRAEFEELAIKLGVKDRIDFVGWVAGFDSIKEQLRRADVFVFPTVGEGLPRSVIEAMSNGLVCISSPVDGVVELLESEFMADFDDVDRFVQIINNLIENPEFAKKVSRNNTEKAKRYHESILKSRRKEFYLKLHAISS